MQALRNILASLVQQLENWALGLDGSALGLSALLLLVMFLLRNSLTGAAVWLLAFVCRRIRISLDEVVTSAVRPAIQALILCLPLYGLILALNLPPLVEGTLERLVSSVAIAAVFATAHSLVGASVAWLTETKRQQHSLQLYWLKKTLKAAILVVGLTTVLKVWEIDIGPVLTGMGVLGAAVALAAQDLFRNLVAGIANMSERRFEIGDWVQVEGVVEGIIEKMELRSTVVRRFDQATVQVPNAMLANTTLINYTKRPFRRILWNIQLVYGTTSEQLVQIREGIEQYIRSCGDFVSDDVARNFIRIDKFNDSSIDIMVWCYTNTINFEIYLESKERLLLKIKEIVEEAGTSFAYPTMTVIPETSGKGES